MPSIEQTAANRLTDKGDVANSKANQFGYWLRGKVLPNLKFLHDSTNDNKYMPGWASAGITGSVLGAGLGGLAGMFTGSPGRGALLGAGIGGLGMGALGFMRNNPEWAQDMGMALRRGEKAESYDAKNPLSDLTPEEQAEDLLTLNKQSMHKIAYGLNSSGDDVIRKLYRDTELTLRQKQELTNQVGNLNANELQRLNQMIRGAVGGGVGFVVAKYLLGLGKFGTVLTTIVSGLASARFGSPTPSRPTDSLGRPYYM